MMLRLRVSWRELVAPAVLSFLLTSMPLAAQVGTARLNGTVTDASGAAVPAADVVLEGTQQQFSRPTVTDAIGEYVITAIPPGFYKLVVRKAGFAEGTIQEFQLSSGQASTLNVALSVAATQESIVITAAPPLLQTTEATVGSTVERQQLSELPTLGRNFTSLLLIMPGVSTAPVPRGGPFSVGGTGINPNVFGQRWRNNDYTLDGVSNNEPLFNGVPMLPPPEALAEMKMEAGMTSGANGHASGANINLVTKSGTNELHGSAWEFLRNNVLDARSFFVPKIGPFRWNQFGASVGGPIVIPKLVSKERAWYFFAYYEGIRVRGAANSQALVPTSQQLAGDFSGSPPIYDPYSTVVDSAGNKTRQLFPNNRIPSNLIHPSSTTIATSLYPLPNLAPGAIPGVNYFNPGSSQQNGDQWSGRVDHQFGKKDNFFARYTDANNPSQAIGIPTMPSQSYNRFTNVAVSDTHIFSPTFLVTGRFGMQRLNYGNFTGGDLTVADRAGMLDAFPPISGYPVIPPIAITGYLGLSQGVAYYGPQYYWSYIGDASKTVGKHTLQFGGSIMRTTFITNNQTGTTIQFTTLQTSNFLPNTGFALASYMLGVPESAGRVIGSTEGDMYGNSYSLYFQDNWRFTPKLTFNLGIRYDYAAPLINRHGSGTFIYETGQYVWDQTNPITNAPPNIRHGMIDPDYKNFQPRAGLAYQVDQRTVFRASYGIFDDIFGLTAQTQQGNRGNWPFAFPQSVSGLNSTTPTLFITNPFPTAAAGSTTPLGCQQCLNIWPGTTRTPYIQEWTASVQRQITSSLKAEAIYFGSHGLRITSQIIDNTALVPGPGPISQRQAWGTFPVFVNNGYNGNKTYYDGLSLSLERRFTNGLLFSANYTWSKTLNSVDEMSDNMQVFGALPTRTTLARWKGPAGWDTPHRFVFNYVWAIPYKTSNAAANAIIAGWSLSGILSYDAGLPYSVRMSADVANIGTVSGRLILFPNLVGDPNAISQKTPQQWFNTAAFAIPPSYTYGNAGRNILRSDGLSTWNFTTSKQWKFLESRSVEFRAEFYNLLNHTTFAYPGFIIDSPSSFGKLSSTRNSGRNVQFGLKIRF